MARNSISMKSLIKTGFGISIGVFFAQMIFIFIGIIFFIPGYLILSKSSSDENKSNQSKVGGIILMVIGVIIMGGAGFGLLMDSIGDFDFDF
jgi:uncharacterized membrane protein